MYSCRLVSSSNFQQTLLHGQHRKLVGYLIAAEPTLGRSKVHDMEVSPSLSINDNLINLRSPMDSTRSVLWTIAPYRASLSEASSTTSRNKTFRVQRVMEPCIQLESAYYDCHGHLETVVHKTYGGRCEFSVHQIGHAVQSLSTGGRVEHTVRIDDAVDITVGPGYTALRQGGRLITMLNVELEWVQAGSLKTRASHKHVDSVCGVAQDPD